LTYNALQKLKLVASPSQLTTFARPKVQISNNVIVGSAVWPNLSKIFKLSADIWAETGLYLKLGD
jgi:hypothetical protein